MKFIVLADDLTGAAEVAGSALRFGLTAEVQIGELAPTDADVLVVDADSRSLNAKEAAAKVFDLTQQAISLRPDLLFKKVDSVLRGPVLAELGAMRRGAGLERSLIVCGNPRKRRRVSAGRIFIHDVPLHKTDFRIDPEHPRWTSDVVELLNKTDSSIDAVVKDDASVAVIAPGESVNSIVCIGNVESSSDLEAYARTWLQQREDTLLAGGAEFFEAVLGRMVGKEERGANQSVAEHMGAVEWDGDVLLISGSRLSQGDGWPLIRLNPSQSAIDGASDVCRTLAIHGRAAIRAVDLATGTPLERIGQIANVAPYILANCRPSQVWIEGGRTASTLVRKLELQRLVAIANLADGVVALQQAGEPKPLYVIKPGSYRWPTANDAGDPADAPDVKNCSVPRRPASDAILNPLLWLFTWVAFLAASKTLAAESPDFSKVAGILAEQCLDCHNNNTQEGAVNLERFQSLPDVDADRALWKNIFDVVEAGQMPLPQSGYELDQVQRKAVLDFTRDALSQPDAMLRAHDPGKPVLRRLTRLEYNNTVRDLFGLEYDIFMFPERLPIADKRYWLELPNAPSSKDSDALGGVLQTTLREYGQKYDVLLPTVGLPGDNRAEHGFANRGDTLNFSPLLFEKYLQLATAIASSDRLLQDSQVLRDLLAIEPPKTRGANVSSPIGGSKYSVDLSGSFAAKDRIGKQAADNDTWHHSFVSELTSAFERGSGGTFDVPQSLNNATIAGKGGLLKLRLQNEVLTINPNVDLWLAAFATATETSGEHLLTNRIAGEKKFELTFAGEGAFNPQIQHLAVCVLARRNQQGTVRLAVVLSSGQSIERSANISKASGNVFFSWVAPPGTSIKKLAVDGSEFSGDYVLLDDLGFILSDQGTILRRGLDVDAKVAGDVASQQEPLRNAAASKQPSVETKPVRERVARFLTHAFRREVTQQELESALSLVSDRTAAGDTQVEALRRMLQCVLASPEFLFLVEPMTKTDDSVRPLGAYELANRLSYFLWSSMPDEELLATARRGTLLDRDVMQSQIRRMLADRRRSRELSESFATQWLRLDQLYSSKPDRKLFKRFYSGPQGKSTLHGPMLTEALLLFETVLAEDRSILELYDPTFSWLNVQLADLYGLETSFNQALSGAVDAGLISETTPDQVSSKLWLRTTLPDRTRGGMLTMAGPLTLTSLPFRTSPIKRGAWILETVFNRPPVEPKVAFVLEESAKESSDLGKTKTIRQLFEQHRGDPNCYSCHSRIDPPGFSLEVFDAMGAFRSNDGDQPVDASGVWNGEHFTTPAEFKDAIRAGERELVRGFVEHLLSYALGRKLEHFDMWTVDRIVTEAADNDYRISAIIDGIVLSYPFQHVRNLP
ncbi:MAG: DUF1592 domain-containing protein [Pirellulaceae bacterium]